MEIGYSNEFQIVWKQALQTSILLGMDFKFRIDVRMVCKWLLMDGMHGGFYQ